MVLTSASSVTGKREPRARRNRGGLPPPSQKGVGGFPRAVVRGRREWRGARGASLFGILRGLGIAAGTTGRTSRRVLVEIAPGGPAKDGRSECRRRNARRRGTHPRSFQEPARPPARRQNNRRFAKRKPPLLRFAKLILCSEKWNRHNRRAGLS